MTDDAKSETAAAKPSLLSRLPQWVHDGLTPRSLRMLVRCWAVCWVAFLLLLIGPSLRALGQAAFFGAIVSFILPANMPTAIYIMAAGMVVLGASLGWAWSVAALASGLRARDVVLLAEQVQTVRGQAASSPNPDAYYQRSIFEGKFLDARASAVVGVYFCIGVYALAWLQITRPRLKVLGIFGSILLDINCSYGPLFPTAYYTLGEILYYPLGCAIGIGVAAQVFIFPESFAFGWQLNLIKLLRLNAKLLDVQHDALRKVAAQPHESNAIEATMTPALRAMQGGMVTLADAMRGQAGFLQLDVAFGHFTPRDLKQVFESIRTHSVRLFGLDAFLHTVAQAYSGGAAEGQTAAATNAPVTLADTPVFLDMRERMQDVEREHDVEMHKLLNVLAASSSVPLQAAKDCITAMADWIEAAAHHKQKYNHAAWLDRLSASLDALQSTRKTFDEHDRLALIAPYEHMFTQHDGKGPFVVTGDARDTFRQSARPLYVVFVFAANMVSFLDGLEKTAALVLATAQKRPNRRLRLPAMGLGKLFKLLNTPSTGGESGGTLGVEATSKDKHGHERYDAAEEAHADEATVVDDDDDDNSADADVEKGGGVNGNVAAAAAADKAERTKRSNADARQESIAPRDPDALPPTRAFHYIVRAFSAAYSAFWSPQGAFALRYTIVSFALWIPSVIPSSAFFVYSNKGLWALIMAQTGLALSGGELMFSLITRLLGTLAGLVIGMLMWYISCGNAARGNVYGLGAVTAVGFIPLMWLRIHAPPSMLLAVIMMGVTTVLAVGYSWIDTHLVVQANSGKGVDVAWRRALLVIIGMTASIIVTLFPRPPSTRESVRLGFAKNTEQLAKLYATIVEGWTKVEMLDESGQQVSEQQHADRIIAALRPRYLGAQAVLGMLQRDIKLSMFDIASRGPWPSARYEELLEVHARLLAAIAQMAGALMSLDAAWRRKMLYTTAILDPLTISDACVTLSLLASALRTGKPLPHAFTPLLETTLHHQGMMRAVQRTLAQQTGNVDPDTLTLDMLRDPLFMRHTAGVMAQLMFVRQLDRLHAVVRELVGEQPLPGYDDVKARFDQRLVQARMASR